MRMLEGGTEGTAHFNLYSLPLVGCSSSLEQDARCRARGEDALEEEQTARGNESRSN